MIVIIVATRDREVLFLHRLQRERDQERDQIRLSDRLQNRFGYRTIKQRGEKEMFWFRTDYKIDLVIGAKDIGMINKC